MTECERCGRRPGALLSLAQAGDCLSVPLETMRWWAHRLRLVPIHKVGRPGTRGLVRVKHRDLDALIQAPRERRLRRVGA